MRNFFYKLQSALARFMYGRNGADQLNQMLLRVYLGLWLGGTLLAMLLDSQILYNIVNTLMAVLMVVLFFRTFSRDLERRRAENRKFLAWWQPRKNRIAAARQYRRDKEHKYFTCRSCKTICRVPAGKGKIVITCPKCGGKIMGKS